MNAEKNLEFKFIDLFAGIGGIRLGFEDVGGQCVFSSEWDKYAQKTYEANFGEIPHGDITKITPSEIPQFDILLAGFPCQPFSQAGLKKGFEDTRGTLFFDIAKIIDYHKPNVVFLENVKNLAGHDQGRTLKVIIQTLQDLDYKVFHKILNAKDFGLPQNRARIYIICFKENIDFEFPDPIPLKFTMTDVFNNKCNRDIGYTLRVGGKGSGINDRRNWDAYLVDGKVRIITHEEGKRMMGFPDDFVFPVTKTQALKQLGNSVAVPVIKALAKKIIERL